MQEEHLTNLCMMIIQIGFDPLIPTLRLQAICHKNLGYFIIPAFCDGEVLQSFPDRSATRHAIK
jgi:hypothetical protein